MGEFELIGHYFAAAPCAQGGDGVVRGIGDDCALLALATGEQLAVSTDTLVAGVHFPESCDAFLLGQRALAVSASDLAAMGATPLAFTLALTLPAAEDIWLAEFARGLQLMAQNCSLVLVGGDTTRGPLSLTLTVFGRVPAGQALTRCGAQVGDLLCVGGSLGDAKPQLALGQALRGRATAALDISDGLLADCGHIAKASGVALQVEQARLPLSPALLAFAGERQALACALSGGDDYRLAFTLPPALLADLQADWPEVRAIGRVLAGSGVQLLDGAGRLVAPPHSGYQHF
jgi:thiamine-monophosphate kinase